MGRSDEVLRLSACTPTGHRALLRVSALRYLALPDLTIPIAAAITLIALIAACSPPPPVQVAPVVAPLPKVYTCDESRRLANEFAGLPAGSMMRQAIQDYGQERDELRAVHGLPKPAACP